MPFLRDVVGTVADFMTAFTGDKHRSPSEA
jgi:hypothetical protein